MTDQSLPTPRTDALHARWRITDRERGPMEADGELLDSLDDLARNLERENAALRKALKESRECLGRLNEIRNGGINDTLWFSTSQTLFDYMDAALKEPQK